MTQTNTRAHTQISSCRQLKGQPLFTVPAGRVNGLFVFLFTCEPPVSVYVYVYACASPQVMQSQYSKHWGSNKGNYLQHMQMLDLL